MVFQQEHLPKEEPATFEERWPFSLESFLEERWMYLVAIIVIIAIFLYARHRWRKRNGL
ncbi:MAG TPA: hypothetical protein VFM59_06550 [Salinimicrobium sp.]|nr:hypothetical protein [Salinimicrobium sp.]